MGLIQNTHCRITFFFFSFSFHLLLNFDLSFDQVSDGGGASLRIQILCRILFTKPQLLIKKNQSKSKTSQDGYTLEGVKKVLKKRVSSISLNVSGCARVPEISALDQTKENVPASCLK